MSFYNIPTQMKSDNLLLINMSSHLGEDKYQLFVYKCLWCKRVGSGHLKWKQLWINEVILWPSIFTTWPPIKVLVHCSCSYWICHMDDNHFNYITKLKNQETLVGQKYCMLSTFLPSAYNGLLNENMFKLFTSLRWQW